jgi:hypothetical protein
MFAGMQRHVDADARGKFARPHAGAENNVIRFNIATGGAYAGYPLSIVPDRVDFRVLEYSGAARPRTLGECLRNVDSITVAVGRYVNTTEYVFRIDQWQAFRHFFFRQDVYAEVEHLGHRGISLQFLESPGMGGERIRPALAITRRLARFNFEFTVQICRIARQIRHAHALAKLPYQAGGVPGGAGRKLLAFE